MNSMNLTVRENFIYRGFTFHEIHEIRPQFMESMKYFMKSMKSIGCGFMNCIWCTSNIGGFMKSMNYMACCGLVWISWIS